MRNALLTLAIVALVGLLVGAGRAQEVVTLTTPTVQTITSYRVQVITLDLDAATIYVQLRGSNNELIQKTYNAQTTPTGATLLRNLNTGNFSTNSLIKAVYNRLLADGVIPAGSVTGTAQ